MSSDENPQIDPGKLLEALLTFGDAMGKERLDKREARLAIGDQVREALKSSDDPVEQRAAVKAVVDAARAVDGRPANDGPSLTL